MHELMFFCQPSYLPFISDRSGMSRFILSVMRIGRQTTSTWCIVHYYYHQLCPPYVCYIRVDFHSSGTKHNITSGYLYGSWKTEKPNRGPRNERLLICHHNARDISEWYKSRNIAKVPGRTTVYVWDYSSILSVY